MTLNELLKTTTAKCIAGTLAGLFAVGVGTGIIGLSHDPKGGYRAGAPIAYAGGEFYTEQLQVTEHNYLEKIKTLGTVLVMYEAHDIPQSSIDIGNAFMKRLEETFEGRIKIVRVDTTGWSQASLYKFVHEQNGGKDTFPSYHFWVNGKNIGQVRGPPNYDKFDQFLSGLDNYLKKEGI